MYDRQFPDDKNSSKKKRRKITVTEKFLLGAVRSTGYTVYTAIYELVDNSIDARSNEIKITYTPENGTIIISDNGSGMSLTKLNSSMDLGSDRTYTNKDTGYFGVGLKSAILNLIDVANSDASVKILTSDGKKTSELNWEPLVDLFEFESDHSDNQREKGTTIIIKGVKKFNTKVLMKNCGVIFYPTLRNEVVAIFVDDVPVIGNDPLYRDSTLGDTNYVDASVKGVTIELNCTLINKNQPKHSWDRETLKEGDWAATKGGIYAIYGGRYIEFGGNYATGYQNPWDSRTRIEFRIPKELTEEFGVKFNKTNGADFTKSNTEIEDVVRKIKDLMNWARIKRDKSKESISTTEEQNELSKHQKALNAAATNSDINPPKTEFDEESVTESKEPIDTDTKTTRGSYAPRRTPNILENKIFILRSENLGSSHQFWALGFEFNKFVIILNEAHAFYRDMYRLWPENVRQDIMFLLASMAAAQYETRMNETDFNPDQFWESFWSSASIKLKHLINNK